MDLVAQPSSDLNTSSFSGGIEWVRWSFSGGGGAVTAEGWSLRVVLGEEANRSEVYGSFVEQEEMFMVGI